MEEDIIFKELQSLLEQKKFKELKEKAEEKIKSYPDRLFLLEFHGVATFLLKEFKKSAEIFRKALDLDSNSVSAYLHLARIAVLFRSYREANSLYDKVIKLDKNNYLRFIEYGSFLVDIQV